MAETGDLADADPEVADRVMRSVGTAGSAAIERHGGFAEIAGDGSVVGVFGVPHANEDDAMRALRAATELRKAVASLGLGATVAVHTGETIAADGAVVATGDVRRTAQGLEHAAAAGEILLTDATRRLVPSAAQVEVIEPVELRGRRPLEAWRLVDLVDGAPAFERGLEAPLVGRAHELEQLDAALRRAVRERTLVLFTLLGTAGVGKSRLTGELLESIESDVAVLVGEAPLLRRGGHLPPAPGDRRAGDGGSAGRRTRRAARR